MRTTHDTTYLIDGSGYIFRAFYAIQRLSTKDGFPTNALYGFLRKFVPNLHPFAARENQRRKGTDVTYQDVGFTSSSSDCSIVVVDQFSAVSGVVSVGRTKAGLK